MINSIQEEQEEEFIREPVLRYYIEQKLNIQPPVLESLPEMPEVKSLTSPERAYPLSLELQKETQKLFLRLGVFPIPSSDEISMIGFYPEYDEHGDKIEKLKITPIDILDAILDEREEIGNQLIDREIMKRFITEKISITHHFRKKYLFNCKEEIVKNVFRSDVEKLNIGNLPSEGRVALQTLQMYVKQRMKNEMN